MRSPLSRPAGLRGLLAAGATVVVTVAALAVAGAAPRGAGPGPEPEPRAEVRERTFVCTGGIKGAVALHGSGAGGPVQQRPLDELLRIEATDVQAGEAFAVQFAGRPSLAMAQCPEPANEWWFVGAGGAVGHATTLVVDNPRPGEAVVDIEVLGPRGEVDAPGLRGITIPGHGTRTFELPEVAATTGDVAVHVTASRGLVSVGATDRFVVGRIGSTTREWLPDQSTASRQVHLVGLPRNPARADLLVANPGEVDVVVEVEMVGQKGPFVPKGKESLTVPPGSVAGMNITSAFDGAPVSLRLDAQQPVVATVRSISGGDIGLASAATPLEGSSVFGAPGAGVRELLVTALGSDASYRLVTYDATGKEIGRRPVRLAAETTGSVKLPANVRFGRLVGSGADAVAGLLISDGGLAATAVPTAVQAIKLPVVRPGW